LDKKTGVSPKRITGPDGAELEGWHPKAKLPAIPAKSARRSIAGLVPSSPRARFLIGKRRNF
jgi:hypothetical protein